MTSRRMTYEEEAYQYHRQRWAQAMALRASRGLVIRAGTLAALGGASAVNALLAACAGGSREGLRELEVGKVREEGKYEYSRFPLVDKYHWRRYPWPETPYLGGHEVTASSPPNTCDLLRVEISPYNAVGNTLLRHSGGFSALAAGRNPGDFIEIEPDDITESVEKSPDLSTWTFRLKRGVKWHNIPPVNGRELIADDVVYAQERMRSESIARDLWWMVEKSEALDRYTVRFRLKRPILFFPETLSLASNTLFAREHVEGDQDYWNQQPISTGAFSMEYSKIRDQTRLVRFPDYIGKDSKGRKYPYNDRWTWLFIADVAARLAAFRSRQIDYIDISGLDQLEDILATNPDAKVHVRPRWSHHAIHIMFQHENPTLQDVRVRRALSMGIDRKKMGDLLYGGAWAPSTALGWDWEGRSDPYTLEELSPYMQYNPNESRRLLAEAGYQDGLTLDKPITSENDVDLLIRDMWREIGVEMKFRQMESTVFTALRQSKRWPDLFTGPSFSILDMDSWVSPVYTPGGPRNFANVNDPVLVQLMEKQRYTLDADERQLTATQFNERAHDQAIHLWHVSAHLIAVFQPWHFNALPNLHLSLDASGRFLHREIWLDDTAPAGRGGKKAV